MNEPTPLSRPGTTTIDVLMKALRDEADKRKLTKRALAELADLHPNTLAHFDRDDWRPSIYTIRSLEIALLPQGLPAESDELSGAVIS